METIMLLLGENTFLKFKSYYVVWKRDVAGASLVLPSEFKSYYVVWKLRYVPIALSAVLWFKSYYVVWKLIQMTVIKNIAQGLNRTM